MANEKSDTVSKAEDTKIQSGALPQQVMTGPIVRELEMLPKLEAIKNMGTLVVGGTTTISDEVIGAIVNQATTEVEGVAQVGSSSLRSILAERVGGTERRARGVNVEAGRKEAIVDITVRLIYGYSVPQTVIQIRHSVADKLLKLAGLTAKEVNIRIASLDFPDRLRGRVQ